MRVFRSLIQAAKQHMIAMMQGPLQETRVNMRLSIVEYKSSHSAVAASISRLGARDLL